MNPLVFEPILKRTLWGGTRLGSVLHKHIGDGHDYAESWEVCDRDDGQSVVSGGEFDGWTLRRLMTESPGELLGRHAELTRFPLLVKFLDARQRLSLQVHPPPCVEQGEQFRGGTTEAWVILAAEPGSRICAGLKKQVDRPLLEAHLAAGSVEECLHMVDPVPGDCYFIPAGTVHAIGAGILAAEVKQTDDVTYRLHDWGRLDRDGRPRPVHVSAALDCIDFDRGPLIRQVPRVIRENGGRVEELVRCPQFVMQRQMCREACEVPPDGRLHVLMILDGGGGLVAEGESFPVERGRTVLLPAARGPIRLIPSGELTLLDVCLP